MLTRLTILTLCASLSTSPLFAPQALAEPATAQAQPQMRAAFEVLSLRHRKLIQDIMLHHRPSRGIAARSQGPAWLP